MDTVPIIVCIRFFIDLGCCSSIIQRDSGDVVLHGPMKQTHASLQAGAPNPVVGPSLVLQEHSNGASKVNCCVFVSHTMSHDIMIVSQSRRSLSWQEVSF